MAFALNSSLELWEVLKGLARITLEETGADRCSVFVLENEEFRPAVALAGTRDERLWRAFRSMGPLRSDEIGAAWECLHAGLPVVIEDSRTCDSIPRRWVDQFSLVSVALVPLIAEDKLCGLMAVDYGCPHSFAERELSLLGSIASYAGMAVRNARLYESTRRRFALQEGLARTAAALVQPLDRVALAERLVDAYGHLFPARLCAIALASEDDSRVVAAASFGLEDERQSIPVSEIPEYILERLRRAWREGRALEFRDDAWFDSLLGNDRRSLWYLVLPLRTGGYVRGGVVVGLPAGVSLAGEERAVALALADIASAAFERSSLADRLARQLRHMELLHNLGAAVAEKGDARVLVRRLNRLLKGHKAEVTALAFRDRNLARRLGGTEPTPEERRAWREGGGVAQLRDGAHAFTMRVGSRIAGSLRVSCSGMDPEQRSFLETLAHGVGEVAYRMAARAEVEEVERERAIAAERGRIASELHDTAGQLFTAVGLLARREGGLLPPGSPWEAKLDQLAQLADRGRDEINRAIQALAYFPEGRRGLGESLTALARAMEVDSGIPILVDVSHNSHPLAPPVERALYRVAHDSLANAVRLARCSVVRLELLLASDEVVLRVSDDGVGPLSLAPNEIGGTWFLAMGRAVDEIGGELTISPLKPHGTVIETRVARSAS
ncbi:MAG: sensor histidine kinase [Actinomycetota bacterium]